MIKDPALKGYENSCDVVKHDWAVNRVGDEAVGNLVLSRFSFQIGRSATETWRYMKELGAWMEDINYSGGVDDDAEGREISLTISEKFHDYYKKHYAADPSYDPCSFKKSLIVKRVVPEKLFVLEGVSGDGRKIDSYYLFALHEGGGSTTVSGLMSHSPTWVSQGGEAQLREFFQSMCNEVEDRWLTRYIPRLRQLVEGG